MSTRPARKRAAGSVGEIPSQGTSKKTRFVEPADDPANFAEEVDANLEDPSAHRKGRIKTEGYDSDSSDDGESVVRSRRPGADGAVANEDEDMFAAVEEAKQPEEGGKQKEEKYLRLGDIEGQEFGAENEEDSESDAEPEDEDEAERRKKEGMGYELSGFNMREEMEEGKFTEDGTYVRSFDPHAMHDRWMEGLDEREIKKARRNARQRDREQKEKQRAEEEEMVRMGGKDSIEQELVGMLKKGETVLEALQRLGSKTKKTGKPAHKKPNTKRKAELNGGTMQVDKETPKETSDIDRITHLASTLMSLGDTDVYSKTYEELVRSVRASGKVDSSWMPPSADVRYEYKWDVPGAEEGQVFGPFSEEDMRAWFIAAYFGTAGEKVKVRKVGGDWGSWSDIVS